MDILLSTDNKIINVLNFWNSLFKDIICCPNCSKVSLKILQDEILCENCKSLFPFKNEIPHLFDNAFKDCLINLYAVEESNLLKEESVFKANINFHNENAKEYDKDPAIQHLLSLSGQTLIRECIDLCRKTTKGNIWVDAGCGTGQLMSIAQNFPITVGFDISEGMATVARNKGHFVFLSNSYHIPCNKETVDLVTACALLHHLPDPGNFLKEAFRILKPGGMIFTDFDPNNRPSHGSLFIRLLRKIYRNIKPKRKSIHTKDETTQNISNLADFHMYFNFHFNGESISQKLSQIGFEEIRVEYYFNKPGLNKRDRPPLSLLFRRLIMVPPWKMFSYKEIAPHFLILAKKPIL